MKSPEEILVPQGDDEPTVLIRALVVDAQVATGAFYRALIELQADHDRLAAALERLDEVGLEIAACDLGCTWHSARLAHNALVATSSISPVQRYVAKLALQTGRWAIERLFARALEHASHAAGRGLVTMLLRIHSTI